MSAVRAGAKHSTILARASHYHVETRVLLDRTDWYSSATNRVPQHCIAFAVQ
jgi:hypothetical protein